MRAPALTGILSAAVDYGFVSHDEFIKLGKDFAARCRANYNCAGTLGDEVVRMADKVMPADAHIRLSNMSVAYMALSTPAGRVGIPEGDYVTKFKSRQGEPCRGPDVPPCGCAGLRRRPAGSGQW